MADYTTWTDSALAAQYANDQNAWNTDYQAYIDCLTRSQSTGEDCSGWTTTLNTLNAEMVAIQAEQQRRAGGGTPPPPSGGGGGGGTTQPPGEGPITINVAAPTVNFDVASIKKAIDDFDRAYQVEGIQAAYKLIAAVEAIKVGGADLGALGGPLRDDIGRGLAEILDTISIDMGQLKEIFRAIAPLGAAFKEESLPPIVGWATTSGINTAEAVQKARLGDSLDWPHWIWEHVGSLAGEVRDPFIKTLEKVMGAVHAPGKALGGVMADLIMNETIEGVKLVQGSSIQSASDNASQLWRTMYGLGMSAHLFAEAGELVHPFKQLGLPQAAAFAVDMAGFGRVGASIIGALTDAGVRIPMHYAALRQAQPEIPGFRQLSTMFRRGAITEASARESLQYHGFNKDYSDAFIESWYRAPSLYELSVLLQDSDADSTVLHDMLLKNGYRPSDADNMLAGLERKVVAPGRTKVIDAALALFEKGLMTDGDLRAELSNQALRADMIDLLAQAGTLRARATLVSDATTEFIALFTNGLLDEDNLRTSLTGLGYSPQRVDILVGIQVAKQKGRITTKEEAGKAKIKAEYQRESITLYRAQFDAGLIDASMFQEGLLAVGIDPQVAGAIVGIDQVKISQRTTAIKTAQAEALHKQIIDEITAALRDQYRKGLIDRPQLTVGLSQLGLDPSIVQAITAQEQALAQPRPKILIDPPVAIIIQVTTERLRTAVIAEFKKGIIDEARAKAELVASGEAPGIADQDLRLAAAQSYRTPKAPVETQEEKQIRTAKKEAAIVEFHAGVIDETALYDELVSAGYSENLSDALVSLEVAKEQAKAAAAAEKAALAAEKKKPVGA